MMKDTPMYKSYVAVAPHPEDFPKLLDAMGAYMRQPYDWADDVKTLKMPVMLIFGDSDMFRPEHIVEFYHLLGGGLGTPAGCASTCRGTASPSSRRDALRDGLAPALVATALPFLNGVSKPPTGRNR